MAQGGESFVSDKSWKFRVLDYSYTFHRPTDQASGQASGRTVAGRFTFLVELVPAQTFWDFFKTNKMLGFAKLSLWGPEKESPMKTIEFENFFFIDMTEDFSAVGGQPATVRFTITCEKFRERGAQMENEWSRSLVV